MNIKKKLKDGLHLSKLDKLERDINKLPSTFHSFFRFSNQ